MTTHYNSWPLGKLPAEWQRPEPAALKTAGYVWEDPRDIIDIFEQKLAKYAGSKYAVTTDSCSNAVFLALKYRNLSPQQVVIPARTYVSIPMQLIHAGHEPVFDDIVWQGAYELGDTGVMDGAGRFTKDMYVGGGTLQTLSFQIKKRLPIGRGGAILTDDYEIFRWLKLASYDGRDLTTPYDSEGHVSQLGWHYYMTPEDAARGILLMDQLPETCPDTMNYTNYPDLREMSVFKQTRHN